MGTIGTEAKPLFRYQGGKIKKRRRYVDLSPSSFRSYFEPFLGCSAIYFELWNRGFRGPTFLSDFNLDIVCSHLTVKSQPMTFFNEYAAMADNDSKDFFRQIRDMDVSSWPPARRAARTVYLAKAAYCGLLHTKRDGSLSASYGDGLKCNVRMDYSKISVASTALWSATICHADFGWIDSLVRQDDFVFLDPPYHSTGDGYTATGFSIDDQVRLERLCRRINERGGFFLQTNSDCPFIRDAYKGFHLITVPPRGSLHCDGTRRHPMGVVIISNYDPSAAAASPV